MKNITTRLLAIPIALMLSFAGLNAEEHSKTKKTEGKDKTPEKEWKRATEGHRPQDLNGDGIITRNEWPGNDASFREVDTDGDGVLTKKDRGYAAQGGDTRMYDRAVNDYDKKKPKGK